MRITDIIDPLPDEFGSEEEAAEFWDAHAITDCEEFLEPVELEVDLERRRFEIEVDEEAFRALRDSATPSSNSPVKSSSSILRPAERVPENASRTVVSNRENGGI